MDQMLKDELEAVISSDEGWSGLCSLILAIGIIGEYAAIKWLEQVSVRTVRYLFKRALPSVLMLWTKRARVSLEVVFAVMVVLGVVGEWFFSGRIAKNAHLLQQNADAELAQAVYTASAAIKRSEAADAHALHEIDARIALEKDFLWRGPRDVPIRTSESLFTKRLSRFPNQKFRISVCDPEPDRCVSIKMRHTA